MSPSVHLTRGRARSTKTKALEWISWAFRTRFRHFFEIVIQLNIIRTNTYSFFFLTINFVKIRRWRQWKYFISKFDKIAFARNTCFVNKRQIRNKCPALDRQKVSVASNYINIFLLFLINISLNTSVHYWVSQDIDNFYVLKMDT